MSQQAKVTAIDVLEAFRANLILYVNKARPALEEVSADALRTRLWLENEQRTHWENELRRRSRDLEEAQQTLFSARISNLRNETAAEIQAVHRARRARDEAETKLRVLKKWHRDFESRVLPLLKQVEKLHTLLANDLAKATLMLAQAGRTLDAYASTSPAALSANQGQAGGQISTVTKAAGLQERQEGPKP